jgi:transcriptional regulator GlxA family with amidase domain
MAATSPTVVVSFLLAPRFPLLSLAICTESLRVANRELGEPRFGRQILTLDGQPTQSSSGIELPADAAFSDVHVAPALLVLSSYQPEEVARPDVLAWLRRQDRQGSLLGCVDTGAYVLAKAGLLGGRHVVAHRETLPAYEELFGDAVILDRLEALEGRIASSAGGMATMDMMLKVIAYFSTQDLANRVAHVLNYSIRDQTVSFPAAPGDAAIGRVDRRLGRLLEIMHAQLETPIGLAEICQIARVEESTARRLFLRHLKETPGRYYLKLRLARARSLLTNSALPVGQIATLTGFSDPATFTHAYRRHFLISPSRDRRADPGHRAENFLVHETGSAEPPASRDA